MIPRLKANQDGDADAKERPQLMSFEGLAMFAVNTERPAAGCTVRAAGVNAHRKAKPDPTPTRPLPGNSENDIPAIKGARSARPKL